MYSPLVAVFTVCAASLNCSPLPTSKVVAAKADIGIVNAHSVNAAIKVSTLRFLLMASRFQSLLNLSWGIYALAQIW